MNSTWVLMNSATDIWPDGLGSSSGQLGHNLMDHHFRTGAVAMLKVTTINIITVKDPTEFMFHALETSMAKNAITCVASVTRVVADARGMNMK